MEPNQPSIHIDTSHYTSVPLSPRTHSYDTAIDSHSSSSIDNPSPVKINIVHIEEASHPLISNIEEEANLKQYTDNHFVSITNNDLERVRNLQPEPILVSDTNLVYNSSSNSPVLSILDSNRGSRSNSDDEPEIVNVIKDSNIPLPPSDISYHKQPRRRYNKLNYHDAERYISKFYKQTQHNTLCSNVLDILTTFVKGQKNLYAQSKILTQHKLYSLVFPAILLSAIITIISPFVECKPWNTGIISGLNAIVTLFISLLNLLKYESSVEMYSLLASLFDNIETSLELTNNTLMISQQDDNSSIVLAKFKEVETKISDYKLTNAVLIPEEIKLIFPIISHVNVFSFVKKTELHKKKLIEQLRDIKNEIYYILYKWEQNDKILQRQMHVSNVQPSAHQFIKHREQDRLNYLYKLKEETKNEIVTFQDTYSLMDMIFTREIISAEQKRNKWWFLRICYYFNPPKPSYEYLNGISPILSSYFRDIIDIDFQGDTRKIHT